MRGPPVNGCCSSAQFPSEAETGRCICFPLIVSLVLGEWMGREAKGRRDKVEVSSSSSGGRTREGDKTMNDKGCCCWW